MEQKLDPEFKKRWVEALRSGEFKQGIGTMFDPDKNCYCCLGVAGVVCGVPLDVLRFNAFVIENETPVAEYNYPVILCNMTGLAAELAQMNDDGKPFLEIADYIESNL